MWGERESSQVSKQQPIFSDIRSTTFKIRLKRPFALAGGTFERLVELRWLDDAIEWVGMMGYTIAAIDEISFQQPDDSWHCFTGEEVEAASATYYRGIGQELDAES